MSASLLAHYDPKLPLRLAEDALAYGMGAVISHLYPDASERPIVYTSHTFTAAECNYAQIEKEAYSLVFGGTISESFRHGEDQGPCKKLPLVAKSQPAD